MSNRDQGAAEQSDAVLEQLLSHASPRAMPSESDRAAVRQTVHAEWRAMSDRRASRRRLAGFAIAATVLLAVFSTLNLFRAPMIDAVQVAMIEKSFGSIYLLGEASELRETSALSRVLSGQTIVTGEQAGMALAWGNGGSLRIDAGTRVRFVDDASVFLESGRIYFDSTPSKLIAASNGSDAANFVVDTAYGEATHIGTQFMTRVGDGDLVVSVREGRVEIDGRYENVFASSGEQVTISERGQLTRLSINRSGGDWQWVSRTSSMMDVEGKSLHEFLVWACRETGLDYHYEGDAKQRAQLASSSLQGEIDTDDPLNALKLRVEAVGLRWAVVDGTIYVSDRAINVSEK